MHALVISERLGLINTMASAMRNQGNFQLVQHYLKKSAEIVDPSSAQYVVQVLKTYKAQADRALPEASIDRYAKTLLFMERQIGSGTVQLSAEARRKVGFLEAGLLQRLAEHAKAHSELIVTTLKNRELETRFKKLTPSNCAELLKTQALRKFEEAHGLLDEAATSPGTTKSLLQYALFCDEICASPLAPPPPPLL